MSQGVMANGQQVGAEFPWTIENFLLKQGLMPRSVVVEHNGEAVAPSEFAQRAISAGDRRRLCVLSLAVDWSLWREARFR